MSSKIDQKDINNAAWAACDTFRGVVDPAQYKDYILVMLFLKYITDVWQDHYEEYQKQYGDDDVRIRRKLERELRAKAVGDAPGAPAGAYRVRSASPAGADASVVENATSSRRMNERVRLNATRPGPPG